MRAVLEINGCFVLVFPDSSDSEPEEFTFQEFVDTSGEDAVPVPDTGPTLYNDDVKHYYRAFRNLCKWSGEYNRNIRNRANYDDEVADVKEVFNRKYGESNVDAVFSKQIKNAETMESYFVDKLDVWSRRIGFLPMSERDKNVLKKHLRDSSFRDMMYYRLDRNAEAGIVQSARDLVIEILTKKKKKELKQTQKKSSS